MTAHEVELTARAQGPRIRALAHALNENIVVPTMERMICFSLLGFYKPENRSAKTLARLKHSLTVRTLNSIKYQFE